VSVGGVSVPAYLAPMFESAAQSSGVPANLLAAVAQTESNFNPNAQSSAGAEGLMQFMPGTAKSLGVDPWNPSQAITGSAQMLSGLIQKFGSVPLALAGYNAGPGAVEQYGGIPPYSQTQNYVAKILGIVDAANSATSAVNSSSSTGASTSTNTDGTPS
jgi:soluble lytic murein transglycosylase-like protein